VDLGQIVRDFALAMETVDHRRPQAASHRDAARLYRPGIGPFGEDAAVAMTVAEMQAADKNAYANAGKRRYPGSSHVCDLALGAIRTGPSRSNLRGWDEIMAPTKTQPSRRSFRRTPMTEVP
jgi:hypothetical protein